MSGRETELIISMVGELSTKVGRLDEPIRGNGKPGLTAQVAGLASQVDRLGTEVTTMKDSQGFSVEATEATRRHGMTEKRLMFVALIMALSSILGGLVAGHFSGKAATFGPSAVQSSVG